jgi:hypothetical protein
MCGRTGRRQSEQSQFRSDPYTRLSDEYVPYRFKPLTVDAEAEIANRLTKNTNAQIDQVAFQRDGDFFLRSAFRRIKANDANDAHARGCFFNSQI